VVAGVEQVDQGERTAGRDARGRVEAPEKAAELALELAQRIPERR
jgi:hypothetical protein